MTSRIPSSVFAVLIVPLFVLTLLFTGCANANKVSESVDYDVSAAPLDAGSAGGTSIRGGRASEKRESVTMSTVSGTSAGSAKTSPSSVALGAPPSIAPSSEYGMGLAGSMGAFAADGFSVAADMDGGDGGGLAYGHSGPSTGDEAIERDDVAEEPVDEFIADAGQLTAGEWNDLVEWKFWRSVIEANDWKHMKSYWGFGDNRRISVTVNNGLQPFPDAEVKLYNAAGDMLWTARTDNHGRAELFTGVSGESEGPFRITATANGKTETVSSYDPSREQAPDETPVVIRFKGDAPRREALDVMFVVDATGSMGDEMNYLKAELTDVIKRVRDANGEDFRIRLGMNVYRDEGDDYVVRPAPFTESVEESVNFLSYQSAGGGGDTPEAVEEALADAIQRKDWSPSAQARFLFLVLDAPPHYTEDRPKRIQDLTVEAAAKGIRVIPVASSGVDKETEFLLRFLSIHTGGTYVFLTDHSGIGESHIAPTIGHYAVEYLNDLLVRLIVQYAERPAKLEDIRPRRPGLK